MSTPVTNYLVFKRYIARRQGTSAQAVEVTEHNVVQIRTLWKRPEAKVGQFYVRFGNNQAMMMDAKPFGKYYRDPA